MKNFLSLVLFCILTQTIAQNTIRVIGHRGCRGVMPENTISGFQRAFEDGADGIEWDVVVNGEGKLVVSHEPYFHNDFCVNMHFYVFPIWPAAFIITQMVRIALLPVAKDLK